MTSLMPAARPKQDRKTTEEILSDVCRPKLALLGVRGYFRDTLGAIGMNDRNLYDDAIFVISPRVHVAFNANTDPNGFKKGNGTAESKGVATLMAGTWPFALGYHKGQYLALKQAGEFAVLRDADENVPKEKIVMHQGNPAYIDRGRDLGINIHHGNHSSTSSLGCQTLPPEQWDEFIDLIQREMKIEGQEIIQYVLVERPQFGA